MIFLSSSTVTMLFFGLLYYKVWYIPQHLREVHAEERGFVDAFRRVSVHLSYQLTFNTMQDDANTRPRHPRAVGEDDVCAICFSEPTYACETNCGHVFCTGCFVDVSTPCCICCAQLTPACSTGSICINRGTLSARFADNRYHDPFSALAFLGCCRSLLRCTGDIAAWPAE